MEYIPIDNWNLYFFMLIFIEETIKMELLGKYSLMDKIKLVALLKYLTYIILIWNINCEMNTFGKSSEIKYEKDGSLNISFNRLLAKHEPKKDSYKTYARQKYANYGMNKDIKSEEEKKSKYTQIRGDGINNFYSYMQDYKNRYAKKKGLAKLDCYYEKKVLKKINNIYEITDNIRNNNKFYNRKIYNKYVIRLILFCLLPCIGLLIPIIFNDKNPLMEKFCFSDCSDTLHKNITGKDKAESHAEKKYFLASISSEHFKIIAIMNALFVSLLLIIVLIIVLYILLKYIKYARLRAGKKGNMSVKDYCHFCRDLITAK